MIWVWLVYHSRAFTHCFPIWTFPLHLDRAACFPQTCLVQFSHPRFAFLLCPVHFNHLYQDPISATKAWLKSYFLSKISSCIAAAGNNLPLNWMPRALLNITQKALPFSCLCCGPASTRFPLSWLQDSSTKVRSLAPWHCPHFYNRTEHIADSQLIVIRRI